jgi:hypothetical protein
MRTAAVVPFLKQRQVEAGRPNLKQFQNDPVTAPVREPVEETIVPFPAARGKAMEYHRKAAKQRQAEAGRLRIGSRDKETGIFQVTAPVREAGEETVVPFPVTRGRWRRVETLDEAD